MARLNEPAMTTETIESCQYRNLKSQYSATDSMIVKRKFMRQNRDIARANSAQSLRIRNLENETSRLLTENLGLREQILKLQNELNNGRSQRLVDHTGEIKAQLEAKMLEITGLINTLGEEPAQKKKSPQKGRISRNSIGQSPDQKNWKNVCTLSEAVAGQEGRLPAILENKSYPRKTLEYELLISSPRPVLTRFRSQELTAIMSDAAADTTDSPEIGPPPVSQFVDQDPVKIDLPNRERKVDNDDTANVDSTLSINLEQRKKRRDSIGGSESRKTSRSESTQRNPEITSSLKTGAKRKLSVREDDEHETSTKHSNDSPEDFKFTRGVSEEKAQSKPIKETDKSVNKASRELAIARGAPREKSSSATSSLGRKVLTAKSVNASPKKLATAIFVDEVKAAKADIAKIPLSRERFRDRRHEIPSLKPNNAPAIATVEVQPEPETPIAPDIFSPSSQPSTARTESRDTPPPPDLGPGTEGQRPNRRARGAVSYAEPNLRDKMRRPTKDLVDAVGADSKLHRDSSVKLEEDGMPTAIIKSEPEPDDAWKQMPLASSATVENSPLSGKLTVPNSLPSNIISHRKRRESILYQAESELPRSNSVSSISALLASNRKVRDQAKEKGLENAEVKGEAKEEVDIYDFRGSSPLTTKEPAPKLTKEEKAPSRSSRRHSSIPREIALVSDSEASDMEGSRKLEDALSSRRRQSSLGLRTTSAGSGPVKEENAEKGLKRSTSSTGMTDSGAGASRSERMATRRRSMML